MLDASVVTSAVTLYAAQNLTESGVVTQMKVGISSGYHVGEDVLIFNGKTVGQVLMDYGITAAWDSATGTMSLS